MLIGTVIVAIVLIGAGVYFFFIKKNGKPPIESPIEPPIEPPVYTPPKDWEDEAYLFLYPDVANSDKYKSNPLAHYMEWGQAENRVWKPEGWSSAQYLTNNSDVAGDVYFGTHPLEHWWRSGKDEGRSYWLKWIPPQSQGLHLILDRPDSKHEYFSSLRIPEGLLLGEYGMQEGGPNIQLYDGQLKNELHIPDVESVMKIVDPGDGLPVAGIEHHGRIYKRDANGIWAKKFEIPGWENLVLGLTVLDGVIYGGIDVYLSGKGYMIQSNDKGNTWVKTSVDMDVFGIATDGINIRLVGGKKGTAVFTNRLGNIICSKAGLPVYGWWGVCGMNGIWNMGTWSKYEDGVDQQSYIHAWNGSALTQVYTTNRPHIHAMGIYNNIRYAVATWDWNISGKTSLLLSSSDGYNWSILSEIPCAHIVGMSFGDGGIYLTGGKYREYGRVYFYKF